MGEFLACDFESMLCRA